MTSPFEPALQLAGMADRYQSRLGIRHSLRSLGDAEMDEIFRGILQARCGALVVFPDAAMFAVSDRIARFAPQARVPSVSGCGSFARNGLLLTYGPNVQEIYRSLAPYVDRILRGTKAAELPVELPTRFELVINLGTAKALGLDIPPTLLARADEVIE